jgi:hypothetical protein
MGVLQNGQVGDGLSVSMRGTVALGWLLNSKRLLLARPRGLVRCLLPSIARPLGEWVHFSPNIQYVISEGRAQWP